MYSASVASSCSGSSSSSATATALATASPRNKTIVEKRFYRKRILDLIRRFLFVYSDDDRVYLDRLPAKMKDALELFSGTAIDHFQYVDMVDFYQATYSAESQDSAATPATRSDAPGENALPIEPAVTKLLDSVFLHTNQKRCPPWAKKPPTLDSFVIMKSPPASHAGANEPFIHIPVVRPFNPLDPSLKEKGIRKPATK